MLSHFSSCNPVCHMRANRPQQLISHHRSHRRIHDKGSKPMAQTSRQASLYQQQPLEAPQQPELDLHQASSLLLAYESFQRATGRPMLDCKDLLAVPDRAWDMHCCLLLVDLSSQQHPQQQEAEAKDFADHITISYANAPACMLLQPSDATANSAANGPASPETGVGEQHSIPAYQSPHSTSNGCLEGSDFNKSGSGSSSSSSNCYHSNSLLGLPLSKVLRTQLPAASLQCADAGAGAPGEPSFLVAQKPALGYSRGSTLAADCLFLDVASPSGKVLKRALLFDSWTFEDGRVGRPLLPAILPSQVPVQGDLLSAEEDVRAQADAVRALKVQDGLGNKDPKVVSAVLKLQELKSKAASIHALLLAYTGGDGLEDRGQTPYTILQEL